MKKATYITIAIGCILVLMSVFFKEMHWEGRKEILLMAISVSFVGIILYVINLIRENR